MKAANLEIEKMHGSLALFCFSASPSENDSGPTSCAQATVDNNTTQQRNDGTVMKKV